MTKRGLAPDRVSTFRRAPGKASQIQNSFHELLPTFQWFAALVCCCFAMESGLTRRI